VGKVEMVEFLSLLTPEEAQQKIWHALSKSHQPKLIVETQSSLNRICAENIQAGESLPAFPRSTVDGYAVKAKDTFGASESMPAYLELVGEIAMGQAAALTLNERSLCLVHTGGMVPEGADAVIMLENTQKVSNREIEISHPVSEGENIIQVGEDVRVGDLVIEEGTHIRPIEIGGLLALGITKISVFEKPKIGIISTGDEIVRPTEKPSLGQVRDINSQMLASLIDLHGGEPILFGLVGDKSEELEIRLKTAFKTCDALIVTAGSSVSIRDLTSLAIQKLGKPGILVHGINIKPGKPTILAVCEGKPVFGLPGNPISAYVIAQLFVMPVIEYLAGMKKPKHAGTITAILDANIASQAGRTDYVPVKITKTSSGFNASPIFFKSNLIFNLVKADGLAQIPADANGMAAGAQVTVYPL
jgi:molybdopterin molybdotransferase